MTSVQSRGCPRQERLFVTPLDSYLPPESEFSKQPNGPLGLKSPAAATNILKYSENDLQQIFKTVLEARIPVPAPAASEEPRDKPLKPRFLDVYCRKSHKDYYNFCQ